MKMHFLLKMVIFQCHVSFQGCKYGLQGFPKQKEVVGIGLGVWGMLSKGSGMDSWHIDPVIALFPNSPFKFSGILHVTH